jgi:hypothetical protein
MAKMASLFAMAIQQPTRKTKKKQAGAPIEEPKTKLEALLKNTPGVIRYSVSFISRRASEPSARIGI